MSLLIDGKAIARDRRGRHHVSSFVTRFYPHASRSVLAKVVNSMGGAEYVDDVEGLVTALMAAKNVRDGGRFWKRMSFAPFATPVGGGEMVAVPPAKDKGELDEQEEEDNDDDDDDDDIEAEWQSGNDDDGDDEEENMFSASIDKEEDDDESPPTAVPTTDDVQALASALAAVRGTAACEAAIRPLLMRAVELRAGAIGLTRSVSPNGSAKGPTYTASSRAEHLGIDISSLGVAGPQLIGKRALELFQEQYGRDPDRRWITLASSGKPCHVCHYTESQAQHTLDVALRELVKKRKK